MHEALVQAEAFGLKCVTFNWGTPSMDEIQAEEKRHEAAIDLEVNAVFEESDTDEEEFLTAQIEPKNMIKTNSIYPLDK